MKKIIDMKYTLIITIGFWILISGCSENTSSNQTIETTKNTYDIELIDNEKWVVKEDMMIHIRNMESDIKATSTSDSPNYNELGSELDKNIGLLTSNCTMTGQAHDELHKWLLPFIGLVRELNEADDMLEQKKSFDDILESMKEFNRYFK